jgi:hypothetical protein
MSHVGRGLVAGVVLAVLSAGCGIARVEQAPRDDFSTWSTTPLPPSGELAAKAADPNGSCTSGTDGERVTLILQDRRTEWTAAFIFRGATSFGSCTVTSQASSGGSGPLPEALTSALSIDVDSFGSGATGEVHELGGRVAADVTAVTIALADGRNVTASVGGGHWLTWWPGDVDATSVTGLDAAGQVVVEEEVPG